VKAAFRELEIVRRVHGSSTVADVFQLRAVVRDRQSFLKLMTKREKGGKESALETQLERLICSSADRKATFNLLVDGAPCPDVTFFNLSPVFPSSVNSFPVAMVSEGPPPLPTLAPPPLLVASGSETTV
jgi:hypothetical protein